MFRRVRELIQRAHRQPNLPRLVLEPGGLAIVGPKGDRVEVRRSDVAGIVAYKRDNFTTDEIRLVFQVVEPGDSVHEVSEEWPGFEELFATLEGEFGINPTWYVEIMQPPFAPTPRVLYERAAPKP